MNDATFQKKLTSVLSDNKYDRFVGGKRSGKLDTKRLYRIEQSDKIFKKREERQGKHYSVSLLIDSSGSMSGGLGQPRTRIDSAFELAKGLIPHLQKAGVDLEVVGFNTFQHIFKNYEDRSWGQKELVQLHKDMREASHADWHVDDDMIYDRVSRCVAPLSDKEAVKELKKGDWATIHSAQGNCDGEIIHLSRQRLLKRKGGRIMIILSDGLPHFDLGMNWYSYNNPEMKYKDYDVKKEAQKTIDSGITLLSFGVQTPEVKKHYPEGYCENIKNLDDMYPMVVNKLQKHIKRG